MMLANFNQYHCRATLKEGGAFVTFARAYIKDELHFMTCIELILTGNAQYLPPSRRKPMLATAGFVNCNLEYYIVLRNTK